MRGVGPGVVVLVMLLFATAVAGCAKRPATTTATVPAPAAPTPRMPTSPVRPEQREAGPASPTVPPGGATGPGTATAGPPSPAEFRATEALRDIHFDFDRYDIRPTDAKLLDENARWMEANPGNLILIEGHADERGTNEYNLALGERRAKAAMTYLVAQGAPASRRTMISYGEERPLCAETNEPCWARNRRAHFLVKPR